MAINNEQYLEQIKKEIEALHEKKIQIEQTIKKEKEETEKKKKEEKEKELTAIKNAIKAFNEKHDESYSLVKSIEIKADDFPCRKHLPSDFTVEFKGEPINKTFLEHLESLLG